MSATSPETSPVHPSVEKRDEEAGSAEVPALFCALGSPTASLTRNEIRKQVYRLLEVIGKPPTRDDVLIVPPDYTRVHSYAGPITQMICEYYNFIPAEESDEEVPTTSEVTPTQQAPSKAASTCPVNITILPALGTHAPMTQDEIRNMFGAQLASKHLESLPSKSPLVVVHDWRRDVVTIGTVPASLVAKATHHTVSNREWPAQLNSLLWNRRKTAPTVFPPGRKHPTLVLSIGQVVPHEVMGMANYNKNLFVGIGGVDAIHLSHYIGAVHGMERMMGQTNNPLRDILNDASEHFLGPQQFDLWYILTVVGTDPVDNQKLHVRGLFIGNDIQCYHAACALSLQVNLTLLPAPISNMVVYLDPAEFHSTWLGNKAIYRTRMVMADGGSLTILAPGVSKFGEDPGVDMLIRQYGYHGTAKIMELMSLNTELQENLSVVAHLIHGSTEGRFNVTYCPSKELSQADIENAGYQYGDLQSMLQKYDIGMLRDGWNSSMSPINGQKEAFYFIRNPALGLWALESRFSSTEGL
jgi:nickel-dependent lactate racemase